MKDNFMRDEVVREQVVLLHTNLDDMTGEALGFAQDMIRECGALDVYTTPIYMKKNRPAVQLSCICREETREACVDAFLRYTTTLGVRVERMERYVLPRRITTRSTEAGDITVKEASYKGNVKRKAEYEDLRRIALQGRISLEEAERYLKE